MELDLQSLFGLHMHSSSPWLRPPNPLPSHLGSYKRALLATILKEGKVHQRATFLSYIVFHIWPCRWFGTELWNGIRTSAGQYLDPLRLSHRLRGWPTSRISGTGTWMYPYLDLFFILLTSRKVPVTSNVVDFVTSPGRPKCSLKRKKKNFFLFKSLREMLLLDLGSP